MVDANDLKQFPLLAPLKTELLDALAAVSEEISIPENQWLFHEGDPANAFYFIIGGRVELRVRLDDKGGTHMPLNVLTTGDALGWSAVVSPYVYHLGAYTTSPTQLLRLDGERVRALLEEHPDQGYTLMQGIAHAMAGRVEVISEQLPEMSSRAVIIRTLTNTGIIASVILVVVFGFFILYSTVSGYSTSVPVFLCCAIVPVAFLLVVWFYYRRGQQPFSNLGV